MEEKNYKYMVGVRCYTFNQSKYILDALNGFVMQQTNFPFVIMVVDDASTDGEQDVIARFISEQFNTTDSSVAYEKETDYAHLSYAQHKINKNCYIAALYLKENHYSQRKAKSPYLSEWRDNIKYEALCEGDDYWIDALKLQKQVDFLEENEEYGLVHTCVQYVNTNNEIIPPPSSFYKNINDRIFDGYIWAYYLRNPGFILTCSCCYRVSLLKNEFTFFDHGLFMSIARYSKVFCLHEKSVAYRRNPEGVMMTNDNLYFMHLTSRTRLYQLYYFYKHDANSYYKFDKYTQDCILIAFYASVKYILKYEFKKDYIKKILYIFSCKPMFFLNNVFTIVNRK